jgi:hypothetical protein
MHPHLCQATARAHIDDLRREADEQRKHVPADPARRAGSALRRLASSRVAPASARAVILGPQRF